MRALERHEVDVRCEAIALFGRARSAQAPHAT